uniref:Uncharacterized protein n=1 Tax=Strigamia maritima TaxID=126957 RepID=T1IZD0_STRMM
MVRVISCHHFQAQDIFTVDGEPVALCTVDDLLLVATLQHCVEVRDLQNPGKRLHSFPTVDQAKQMIYCRKGHYIGALEVRASRISVLSFVRVYLNWQVDMKGQPMRARIAGRVTPSSQSGVDLLEMIELPLQKQAFCIATCNETGNLAVGLGEVVSLFRFCVKTHDMSRRTFHDFEPLIDITLSLSAHHLALCEDVIACLSPNELHVIKLKIQPDPIESPNETPVATPTTKSDDVSAKSFELKLPFEVDLENYVVLDENFVLWSFDETQNNDAELKEKLHPDSWPLVIRLPGLTQSKRESTDNQTDIFREVLGPSTSFPVEVNLVEENGLMVVPITLLYRHFSLEDEISTGLHSLHLIPVYKRGLTKEKENTEESLLTSQRANQLCGLTCFFSSPEKGFLYDLIGGVFLVASYPYTSAARAVTIENHLLHAITEAGLETYTMRSIHAALRHLPIQDSILPPPPPLSPVCLVGLQAFLNIEQIVLSKNRLVLMATCTDESSSSQESDSNGWTVYSITKSSPEEFYHDLLEIAIANRKKSPQTYVQLLGEAHCIVRGEVMVRDELGNSILDLYKESCCLLGDFFLMSENSEENKLAVSYYLASEAPVPDVVSRVMNLWTQVHPMPLPVKGLISYLNQFLLEERGFSVQVTEEMADTILDLYADNEPAKLALVVIKDRISGLNSTKAASVLKRRIINKKALPEDLIALSYLCVMNDQCEQVTNLLSTLPKERLIETLAKNFEVWSTRNKTFSAYAKLIRNWRADIFVEVTLELVYNDIFTADEILHMFQEATPDVEVHKIPHLKEFLEALLTVTFAGHVQEIWASDAAVWLAQIYLNRSVEIAQPKPQAILLLRALNLFGPRANWLNFLPPFEGRSLREQCINKNKTKTLNQYLVHAGNAMKICYDYRLRVLSGTPADAVTLLADEYPTALIQYGKDCFDDNADKWQIITESIMTKLENSTPNTPQFKLFEDALQLLLSHLAEILALDAFLNLLPTDEPMKYLEFVQRCCHKHQARLLRNQIITKGLELKASV